MKKTIRKLYFIMVPVLLGTAVILYLGFCSRSAPKLKNLNVILITLDTLRADYISAYQTGKAHTPALDSLAAEGVLFERCIAQTPLTLPSHTSILSGTYPLHHQIRDNGGFLVPGSLEFVSETLQQHGYATGGFIASYVLHSKWGINQGFDTYSDQFDLTKFKTMSLGIVQKRAETVLNNAKKWIRSHQQNNADKKFFSWIHLYDPHTPYDPPSPFKEKYPDKPYRGEVEYMDHQLGIFFDFLKQQKLYQHTLIIIVADHGESLGQHGEQTHGYFIYEPTVHVPLIIRGPSAFPVKRVSQVVQTIDLAPTILEAAQIEIPSAYQGHSLLDLMQGDGGTWKNTAYTESFYPRFHFGWSELKGFYYGKNRKYILAPKEEMYELGSDSQEQNNVILKKSYDARQVKNRLLKFIDEKSSDAKKLGLMSGGTPGISRQDLKKLAALGYLTTVVDTSGKENLPDPKGKIAIFNDLGKAKELMGLKKFVEAVDVLKRVMAAEPNLIDGIFQLGMAYSRQRKYEDALKCFYDVLDRKPDYNAAMINVLNGLIRLGRYDKGIEEAKGFLKIFPGDFSLYNELGTLLCLKKDYDEALKVLDKSIQLETVNPKAFNWISAIYIVRKDVVKAESYLERAQNINPGLRKLNYHLAQLWELKGDVTRAMDYYKKELESFPYDYKAAYNLAEEFRKKGQGAQAVHYYRMAVEANPGFSIPYFLIAKFYLDKKENLEEAVTLCKKGIELKPVSKYTAFGYFILADIFSYRGETSQSQSCLVKGKEIREKLKRENRWN